LEVQRHAGSVKERVITAAAADGWACATLRREHLADNDMTKILQEVEAEQRSDSSLIYKSYWGQWNSILVRDGILQCHWKPADGRTKTVQTEIPRSKVKKILPELHIGRSQRHLGVNKTPMSHSGTTGYTREATLRAGANNVKCAQKPRSLNYNPVSNAPV
jgi:hypothetical protein